MPIRHPEATLNCATGFAAHATVRNLHAQAHARSILRKLTDPSDDWPNFRADLDDRLHYVGHSLLWSGLQLLETGRRDDEVRSLLSTGAEALEFLSANPRYDSTTRIEQAVNATFGYYLAGHYAPPTCCSEKPFPTRPGCHRPLGSLLLFCGNSWAYAGI